MKPTHIRYLVVFIAMLAAVLLYLERVCLSVADVYVREDLHIGKTEMDLAFGAFFIAYALGQVPSGWLSQRYGPRLMMTLYMIGWSVFGVFIAVAQDFWTLLIARFLLGLSQAGAYPTAALLVKRWFPDNSRGLASSIVAFGGRFGGAGANWLTGLLIVAFVPITVPATITPDRIISPKLFAQAAPNLGSRHEPEWVYTIRDRLFAFMPNPTASFGTIPEPDPRENPDTIAVAVNQAIRTPTFLAGIDLSEIAFAADGTALAMKPAAERSTAESERLNRLVIEKAVPGAIRQLHGDGWRPTLLLYGVMGIVVGAMFWIIARNWPHDHPWANRAEVDLIETGQSKIGEDTASDAIPIRLLATSWNQWWFSIGQFWSNVGWVFLISLMPRFLDEVYHVPVDIRGLMTTLPLFAAAFGMIVGGWFTDWLTRKVGKRWGRSIPMGLFKIPCVISLALCPFLPDAWSVTVALTIMSVFQDFGVPANWAFAQDTAGKQVGAVLGWANMWGNLGAGIAIVVTGRVAELLGWNAAFFTIAGAFVLCGICGTLANASIPLFKSQEPTP